MNLILNTDSYKASHFAQYPPGTTHVSSYIEARGGIYPEALFFGLQIFLKEVLARPISRDDIDEAEELLTAHGEPFHRPGWEHILRRHRGYMPVAVEAVAEGSLIPISNCLVQIVNTDPLCAWLTSYLETALLRAIWYPTTVATYSFACKKVIHAALLRTAGHTDGLEFMLHDFGARGVSSVESARIGGLAHLVNFRGSDTVPALLAARRYYHEPVAAFSIPAAEHSTICSWGRDGEQAAYSNMIAQFGGAGRKVSVVSDSYNLWHALDLWGGPLKAEVLASGGTVVIRPDSGDPVAIVPEVVERLMHTFGHRLNQRQFRVLPDCVRVIQGDGVRLESIREILAALEGRGISAENVVFGMGGQLLQRLDRDTMAFAMKASAMQRDGQWHPIAKDPATDRAKRSKPGRLALARTAAGGHATCLQADLAGRENLLQPVFQDGQWLRDESLAQIRARAAAALAGG